MSAVADFMIECVENDCLPLSHSTWKYLLSGCDPSRDVSSSKDFGWGELGVNYVEEAFLSAGIRTLVEGFDDMGFACEFDFTSRFGKTWTVYGIPKEFAEHLYEMKDVDGNQKYHIPEISIWMDTIKDYA